MYNDYGDYMHLFKKEKQKINTQAMMHLIYETLKTSSPVILKLFDKSNIIYDKDVSILVINIFNYELYRYELYRDNKKELVDLTLTKVYDYFFYNQKLDSKMTDAYKHFSEDTSNKMKAIYETKKLSTSKEEALYHLFIGQLRVDETLINEENTREFVAYMKLWLSQVQAVNNTYTLDEQELNNQNMQYIDFRF